jgi:RNA-binding protein YhbY
MLTTEFVRKVAKSDAISSVSNALITERPPFTKNALKTKAFALADSKLIKIKMYKIAYEAQVELSLTAIPDKADTLVTDPEKAYKMGKDLTGQLFAAKLREPGVQEEGLSDNVIKELEEKIKLENPKIHPYIKEYWERGVRDKVNNIVEKYKKQYNIITNNI